MSVRTSQETCYISATKTNQLMLFKGRVALYCKSHMLQVGTSRVQIQMKSLDFSIYLFLPAALWPWSRLRLLQKWVPGIFLGSKERAASSVSRFSRNYGNVDFSQSCGPPRPVTGIALLFFYLLTMRNTESRNSAVGSSSLLSDWYQGLFSRG
jgi:hypothetical protein